MDISSTLQPNSQQVNADDLVAPITVTITNVEAGTTEQPVFIHLTEFPGRTYRPGKSMRRVLVNAWGAEASAYIGRQITLYNDTSIRFGKDVTGGIRISHMSHIDKPLTMPLTVTRGKRSPFVVQPLPPKPQQETVERIINRTPADDVLVDEWVAAFGEATTLAQLHAAWTGADKAGVTKDQRIIDAKNARKEELT